MGISGGAVAMRDSSNASYIVFVVRGIELGLQELKNLDIFWRFLQYIVKKG